MLIRAHALLHQTKRQKDSDGRVIAEIADYAVVRHLVADLVAEGAEATVKPEIREVVKAVTDLIAAGRGEVMQSELRPAVRLDKSAVSRRVAAAIDAGVLRNREDRKGRPAAARSRRPLPDDFEVLPDRSGCAVARLLQG